MKFRRNAVSFFSPSLFREKALVLIKFSNTHTSLGSVRRAGRQRATGGSPALYHWWDCLLGCRMSPGPKFPFEPSPRGFMASLRWFLPSSITYKLDTVLWVLPKVPDLSSWWHPVSQGCPFITEKIVLLSSVDIPLLWKNTITGSPDSPRSFDPNQWAPVKTTDIWPNPIDSSQTVYVHCFREMFQRLIIWGVTGLK